MIERISNNAKNYRRIALKKISKEDYLNSFSEPVDKCATEEKKSIQPIEVEKKDTIKESDTRRGRALGYAIDIRKFEIELYWKRATYFWTIIGVIFVAYGWGYKEYVSNRNFDNAMLLVLFSGSGVIFTSSLYLANLGGKFWQVNWEKQVELLEDVTLGKLYKTVIYTKDSFKFFQSSAPFSISKVNTILSIFLFFLWIFIYAKSCYLYYQCSLNEPIFDFVVMLLFIFSIPTFLLALYKCGKSSSGDEKSPGIYERNIEIDECGLEKGSGPDLILNPVRKLLYFSLITVLVVFILLSLLREMLK